MLRKHALLMLIVFFAAALPAFEVHAQNQDSPQGGMVLPKVSGPGRIIRVNTGLPALLNNAKVQTDLDLSDDQKTKVAEAAKESTAAMDGSLSSIPAGTGPQDMPAKIAELIKENQDKLWEKLGKILLPKQIDRLKEIQIQTEGPVALLRPDLIKALGITDQQQKDMKELNDVFQEKMKNNVTVINMQYSTPEGRQARIKEQQDETLKMKKIFGEFLLKVLTQDQRDKFEKMQGAKIDTGSSTLTLEGRGRGG